MSYILSVPDGAGTLTISDIHRLGRTARAGAEGKGIIILSQFESYFLRKGDLASLPISPYPITDLSAARADLDRAMDQVDDKSKAQAYSAWMGYYNGSLKACRWTKQDLVDHANEYARTVLRYKGEEGGAGWKPPGMMKKSIGMMGLKGVTGLNVVASLDGGGGRDGGGTRGGAAARGGSSRVRVSGE